MKNLQRFNVIITKTFSYLSSNFQGKEISEIINNVTQEAISDFEKTKKYDIDIRMDYSDIIKKKEVNDLSSTMREKDLLNLASKIALGELQDNHNNVLIEDGSLNIKYLKKFLTLRNKYYNRMYEGISENLLLSNSPKTILRIHNKFFNLF